MSVIDDYLKNLGSDVRNELERIRVTINSVAPEAVEEISYAIPAFRFRGKPLAYFAAFKNHMSFFPTGKPIEVLANKLTDFKISKGAIQFTLEKPLPKELIIELLQIRLNVINKDRP